MTEALAGFATVNSMTPIPSLLALFVVATPNPNVKDCRALCSAVERAWSRCDVLRQRTCDSFLDEAERLVDRKECVATVHEECSRHNTSFLDVLQHLATPDAWGRVEKDSATVTRQRSKRALAVLASQAISMMLEGDEDANEQWGGNLSQARLLTKAGVASIEELWDRRVSEAPTRTARASSELPAQGRHRYGAQFAVDNHADTAWCAGHGLSTGEWIEVTVPQSRNPPRYVTFALIPGYGRDARSFRQNNRIAKVRVADCSAADQGYVVDLPQQDEQEDTSGFETHSDREVQMKPYTVGVPPAFGAGTAECVRFTVEEVLAGPDNDTCISEIFPLRAGETW